MLKLNKKSLISVLLFLALVAVNTGLAAFLANALRFDITSRKMFTLSDATKKLLNRLEYE